MDRPGSKKTELGNSLKMSEEDSSLSTSQSTKTEAVDGGGGKEDKSVDLNGPASNEAASSPTLAMAKTPVSLLQELYVRRGITPKYDLVQIEGAVHEPTFKYRVTVGEFVATGCGQSKKKAKHCAAKAVLERIRSSRIKSGISGQAKKTVSDGNATSVAGVERVELPDLDKEILSPYDDGIEGNPVGELQELCMNRRMQPPAYEVSLEEGQPHERKFVIVCSVGKQGEAGFGKSKKLAKRQAANKMLRRLKSQPAESDSRGQSSSLHTVDDDELAQGIVATVRGGGSADTNSKDHPSSSSQALRVAKFYKSLKPLPGTQLQHLQDLTTKQLGEDPCQRLDNVCQEQDFTVTYVELEEINKLGDKMCLLQLSTLPVAVCYGTGENEKAAKEAAAFNALEFLTIMTR